MCILLVEDEWSVLIDMAEALEAQDYEVMTAIDGAEAIALAQSSGTRLTCLVTDLKLSGLLDGKELVEEMRISHPTITVIMTAQDAAVSADWLRQHRAHLLPKPYLADELLAMVRRLVERPGRII